MQLILGLLVCWAVMASALTPQTPTAGASLIAPATQAEATKRRLEALLRFMEKATEGQTSRLWGRNKIERLELRKYNAFGRATVEGVAYEVKIGDTTYQVSTAPSSPAVGFWIRSKKAAEVSFGDRDRDGAVDRGEFNKAKSPAERRKFSVSEGPEHAEFWQRQYEAALDALCSYLGVVGDDPPKDRELTEATE
jgi:hypothetical protein